MSTTNHLSGLSSRPVETDAQTTHTGGADEAQQPRPRPQATPMSSGPSQLGKLQSWQQAAAHPSGGWSSIPNSDNAKQPSKPGRIARLTANLSDLSNPLRGTVRQTVHQLSGSTLRELAMNHPNSLLGREANKEIGKRLTAAALQPSEAEIHPMAVGQTAFHHWANNVKSSTMQRFDEMHQSVVHALGGHSTSGGFGLLGKVNKAFNQMRSHLMSSLVPDAEGLPPVPLQHMQPPMPMHAVPAMPAMPEDESQTAAAEAHESHEPHEAQQSPARPAAAHAAAPERPDETPGPDASGQPWHAGHAGHAGQPAAPAYANQAPALLTPALATSAQMKLQSQMFTQKIQAILMKAHFELLEAIGNAIAGHPGGNNSSAHIGEIMDLANNQMSQQLSTMAAGGMQPWQQNPVDPFNQPSQATVPAAPEPGAEPVEEHTAAVGGEQKPQTERVDGSAPGKTAEAEGKESEEPQQTAEKHEAKADEKHPAQAVADDAKNEPTKNKIPVLKTGGAPIEFDRPDATMGAQPIGITVA
ncbi:hypothetical protein CY652_21905 [Burkholderia sp. WAC0059]|uniref:hypothetical protein n=1 Tax=Burkholderia sp. WAC0059 TaxID=2066022 RepID=UPI000C7F50D3|nr:hypothetical protein [Burkholderia sp. WAC0059]PLZ00300.1 hypothetical protein CY652_21905 [Burkholderia sp. WAC0059]